MSISGWNYSISLTNDASRFFTVLFLAKKSDALTRIKGHVAKLHCPRAGPGQGQLIFGGPGPDPWGPGPILADPDPDPLGPGPALALAIFRKLSNKDEIILHK